MARFSMGVVVRQGFCFNLIRHTIIKAVSGFLVLVAGHTLAGNKLYHISHCPRLAGSSCLNFGQIRPGWMGCLGAVRLQLAGKGY